MGHSPMRKPKTVESSPDGLRRCSSHLLTSINWWSSQKEKNHTQAIKQATG